MDVFYAYTFGSAAWLALQAVPLFVSPKLIIALLAEEGHKASDVEVYLSRTLASSLLALAILLILLTGSIPLTAQALEDPSAGQGNEAKTPYAVPTVMVSTGLHIVSAIYTYTRWTWTGQAVFGLAMFVWTILASVGLWCIAFGSEKGHISRRTGVDKRVSGFPFRNVESDRKKGKRRDD